MGWWSDVRQVFAKAEASSKAAPVVHELLTRHRDQAAALASWRHGMICRQLLGWISDSYGHHLVDGQARDEAIDFLDTPSAKGFVIHFEKLQHSLLEAQLLQLHLRQRVLDSGKVADATTGKALPAYRTQIADTKTYTNNGITERSDRYYLKPRLVPNHDVALAAAPNAYTADQFGQGFGNVLIELIVRNDSPFRLRFSATVYHDRVYRQADSFASLMQMLVAPPAA